MQIVCEPQIRQEKVEMINILDLQNKIFPHFVREKRGAVIVQNIHIDSMTPTEIECRSEHLPTTISSL